jgi:hypothetical protein
VFSLPAEPAEIRIVSRAGVPAELGFARDPRLLGVAVRRIELRRGARLAVVDAAEPGFVRGFHAFEAALSLRWTDGDAVVPAGLFGGFGGPLDIALHIAGSTRYVVADEAA